MKTNLVLTGNTEILDKEYNNILSGEWCLQNKNFKNKIADVNYKVIQYHWSDPLSWWNSTEILKLRDRFSYECCLETQNNFELWINFFKKIKNEK